MKSELVIPLLDKAREVTLSDYKTAQAIGVPRTVISDWRAGRKTTPPEDIALLAQVAGMDAGDWLVRGVLEKHAGTAKGDRLFIALGKSRPATGGGSGGCTPRSARGRVGKVESGLPRCLLRRPRHALCERSNHPQNRKRTGFFSPIGWQ